MKTKRGQSIVETVVAAALISVAIIAALSLANYSQKQTTYSKSLAQATTYNTQVSDWLRKERSVLGFSTMADKAVRDATNSQTIYCLNDIPGEGSGDFTTLAAGPCDASATIVGTMFQRSIMVDSSGVATGTLKITSTVTWQEKVLRTATLETELTLWQ